MNKLETRGQKWFWLAFLLFMGFETWQILIHLISYFQFGEPGDFWDFHFEDIARKAFILALVGLAFYLMDKGYEWPKIIYCSLSLIYAGLILYLSVFSFVRWLDDSMDILGDYLLNLALIFIFNVASPFILMVSPATKAFLKQRQSIKREGIDKLEQQLNQIGNNEHTGN